MRISRRDFIGVAASAAVLGGVGVAALATTPTDAASAPLRPPGGQDEARMLARCLRCDRCRSACPTDCIVLGTPEDGLARMRTPLVSYRDGGCTFCDRCIDACPTGALAPFDPHAEKIGLAQVNPDACVAFRSPGSCKLCQDACSFDAVVIVDGHPKVVRDLCNGCGLCEAACWGRGKDASGATVRGIAVRTLAQVTPASADANAATEREVSAARAASSGLDAAGSAGRTRSGAGDGSASAGRLWAGGSSADADGEVRAARTDGALDSRASSRADEVRGSSARDGRASSGEDVQASGERERGEGER